MLGDRAPEIVREKKMGHKLAHLIFLGKASLFTILHLTL